MPTGLRSSDLAAIAFGEAISPSIPASTSGSAVHGPARWSTTFIGSAGSTVTDVTGMKLGPLYGEAFCASRLAFTALPSNAVPSWNFTPGRTSRVQLNRSADSVGRAVSNSGFSGSPGIAASNVS